MLPAKIVRAFALYALWGLFTASLHAASAPDIEDRTRAVASELRCVVCQNLSVADSPSEMAQQMRAIVRDQLEAGKSAEEVKEFFVSKYGEWVLLKPKTSGVSLLLWVLPYAALLLGIAGALWFIRRWAAKNQTPLKPSTSLPRNESDWLGRDFPEPDLEDNSEKAELLRERLRLKTELAELEFDFQTGKLSEQDYNALKQEIEEKGTVIHRKMNALPPEPVAKAPKPKSPRAPAGRPAQERIRFRRWQLLGGGLFLMLFGLALGVMLTKSIRPRESSSDSMTGDFLTGTTSASGDARVALNEGKQAFSRQDFPKAIEAFKQVLAADPNNPEAHSYMGFILIEAGHADGALMAFDKALSQAPHLPMALWGKGIVLYREKKDFAAARAIFEDLLNRVPPGEDRNEIAKVLAEIPIDGLQKAEPVKVTPKTTSPTPSARISGTITIDPKLKAKVDPNAALFIIARPAGGAAGPPLAVKKIDKPIFPLPFTLAQENVMMQGMPFNGKINLTVRLDRDGNPTTRGAGDMTGEYKKNPVDVGAKNLDIIIDQLTQ